MLVGRRVTGGGSERIIEKVRVVKEFYLFETLSALQ